MPQVNVDSLLKDEEDKRKNGKNLPLRFGYAHSVSYNINNSGTWDTLSNGGRIWRLKIICPNAYKRLKDDHVKESLVDSIDFIFNKYNFTSYPDLVPEWDSTSLIHTPTTHEEIGWRSKKSDPLKVLNIRPKPYSGYYKYPDQFEEFYDDLRQIINLMK